MSCRFYLKPVLVVLLGLAAPLQLGCLPSPEKISEVSSQSDPGNVSAEELREIIQMTLDRNLRLRGLGVDRNAAWQVIHGAVAYGEDLLMEANGKTEKALPYLFQGGELAGWDLREGDLLPSTGRKGIRVSVEEGSFTGQGHVDQFLGYLSQVSIPLSTKIKIGENEHTMEDWARQAQRDICQNPYQEYSWTLIALTNYFPTETQWDGTDGRQWTLEPFVEREAEQDLTRSACGGMHRLMGLAHCVRYREKLGGRFEGAWLRAKQVVESSIAKAKAFQNSDGSFSTRYTERAGNSADLSTCIGATGHTLEFLAYALPAEELRAPWLEKSVLRLCEMLHNAEPTDLECGGGYHALAGLRLYAERRFPESVSN
ncbi:ADP-ribosylation factor-directed GTPase activating protein isoform b [Pirellulaceae bacterium SH467]|jgi:hypothetical protein